jgi:hypothetical protein
LTLIVVSGAPGRIKPVITPDYPERVTSELAAHNVNITSGRESGLW